jgi:hypothetical protein
MAVAVVLVTTLVFVPACSSNPKATAPSTSTSVPLPPAAGTVPGTGDTVALGTNNPAAGDCTTNTSEAASSVGFVVLKLTPSSFKAEIQLQAGSPKTTYLVLMQQVPGSCPQSRANGGKLTTGSNGRGHASATVPRVPGATTFFVQLVPAGSGGSQYTSDRISVS